MSFSKRVPWPIVVAATLALPLAAAVGIWYQGTSSETAYARGLIEVTRQMIDVGRGAEGAEAAARAFARAEQAVQLAQRLFDQGRLTEAIQAAREARKLAEAAMAIADPFGSEPGAVRLTEIVGTVLHRAEAQVSWTVATEDRRLFGGDRVATEQGSSAVLEFGDGSRVRLAQESIIIIRKVIEQSYEQALDLNVTVTHGSADAMVRDVEPGATLVAELRDSEVAIDVGMVRLARIEGGASMPGAPIEVMKGSASIEVDGGQEIVLEPGKYTIVSTDGARSETRDLPGKPRPLTPRDGATVFVSRYRPEVVLRWARDGCGRVRVELLSDPGARQPILDQELTDGSELTLPEPAPGAYLWRVQCLDLLGLAAAPTEENRFVIVGDSQPPHLNIVRPTKRDIVSADSIIAKCLTEPALAVYIDGKPADEVAAGEYSRRVPLAPGLNRIEFEAHDGAGNVGRVRQFVTRRTD